MTEYGLKGYFYLFVSKSFTENNRNNYSFKFCAYQDPLILLLLYFELIPVASHVIKFYSDQAIFQLWLGICKDWVIKER